MWLVFVGAVLVALYVLRRTLAQTPCEYGGPGCMRGRVVVVTGSTAGIGRATALHMARLGATVVMANRSKERSLAVAAECAGGDGACVFLVPCDLADLRSVDAFAGAFTARFGHCDALVLNAAVLGKRTPPTAQGYEQHWGVNYVGHFRLVTLLLPRLQRPTSADADDSAACGRIVTLTSMAVWTADYIDYDATRLGTVISDWRAYAQSKLALVLLTSELHRRYGRDVACFAVDPGVVRTAITTTAFPDWITWLWTALPIASTPEQGAQTVWHCMLAPIAELVPGALYRNCRVTAVPEVAGNTELARQLWERTSTELTTFMQS
jgi:NAD(P)-dependent dehydrogenase (short-subunit alcohol dehydrogenase family)